MPHAARVSVVVSVVLTDAVICVTVIISVALPTLSLFSRYFLLQSYSIEIFGKTKENTITVKTYAHGEALFNAIIVL